MAPMNGINLGDGWISPFWDLGWQNAPKPNGNAEVAIDMPSPLAHGLAGIVIYHVWGRRLLAPSPIEGVHQAGSLAASESRWPARSRLAAVVGLMALSLVPDLDVVPALFCGDMAGFHNQGFHSVVVGTALAPLLGLLIGGKTHFRRWTVLCWLCFTGHVLMDAFSPGRGVMWLWPLSVERFRPPFFFFHGLRWAEGWWAWDHLFTLINELGWVALAVLMMRSRGAGRR